MMGARAMLVPNVVLGLILLAFAANFFLSERQWEATSRPRVATIDTLPDRAELAAVRRYTLFGSGILPYTPREQARREQAQGGTVQSLAAVPIKVGYSYREFSVLRLPLWASEDQGIVTFFEARQGYQIALMSGDQLQLLERITGRSYSGYSFPVWRHMWGWLFLIALIVWTLLRRRAEAKWREETGII